MVAGSGHRQTRADLLTIARQIGGGTVRILILIPALLMLWGCAAPQAQQASDPGPYPDDYQTIVQAWMREALVDPNSVQDLEIATPKSGSLWRGALYGGSLPAWYVCTRFNSKNRMGGYVGRTTYVLFVSQGKLVSASEYAPPTAGNFGVYSCAL